MSRLTNTKHLPLRNIPKIKAKECNKSWDFILVVPDPPSYAMEGGHWRDATSIRLAVPLPYLALGPPACCCHDRFGQRSGSLLDSLRCARGYVQVVCGR